MVEPETESTKLSRRVWGTWATAGFGLIVIVTSVVVQVIIAFIFIIANLIAEMATELVELEVSEWLEAIDLGLLLSLSIIISAIACVGLIIIIIKARKGETIAQYLALRLISAKTVLMSLAISVVYIGLSVLVNMVLKIPLESDIMVEAYATSVWPALFWIAVIVFGPVFEEILFRGFLFEGLKHSRIGVAGTVIVTSLVWSGFHLQYGLFQIASIFVMGVVLGIVRHKTGSLWAPMLMHAFHNLVAMLFIALNVGF